MTSNVQRAAALDTATLSDALDRLGIAGQCLGIKPLSPQFQLTGRAHTGLYRPIDVASPGTVGDYIDDVAPGSVVVLDNAGRADATVWGDILTEIAHRGRVAGTVIDGACRDTHLARTLGYPMFSRSYSMRTGKDRVQLDEMNVPVCIGGVRVLPGDLLRADADGCIVIPASREDAVLLAAEEIHEAEMSIRSAVREGMSLREARQRHKYHSLQSRGAAPNPPAGDS
jgi:4-hydroxy-4-methyl-2-oxoglutarate aldolase